ncbi:MAG: ATP-binding cassette domain-containing protein, partial [Jannaschia sp.]
MRIGSQMIEGLRLDGMDVLDARARATALLTRVGIPRPTDALRRFPHEFSGGMRQRIMIASVLLRRPSLVIADEPTTALDVLVQA